MSTTNTPTNTELAEELRDIQYELIDLLNRASALLQNAPNITRERAQSYWLAHARMAITKDHGFLGGSGVDMEDTIEELECADEDEDA